VLAGVAVALDEGGRQRLDDVRLGAEGIDAALGWARGGAGAAVGARSIQAAGGGGEEALDGRPWAVGGHAGRDRDESGAGDVGALEAGDEPLAARAHARQRGAGHEHGDLVGARAPEHVGDARQRLEAVGHGAQGGVAGGLAAARVERAEVVDVDERQRGGLLGVGGVGEDRVGIAAKGVERQQPGAVVGAGEIGELGLEAGQPRMSAGQRTAQLVTIGPEEHERLIGAMEVCV
jgi:hypothetical protein